MGLDKIYCYYETAKPLNGPIMPNVIFYKTTSPAPTDIDVDEINGVPLGATTNFSLIDNMPDMARAAEICAINNSKDFATIRNAAKQVLIDIGSGDEFDGFDLLSAPDKIIATTFLLGSPVQRYDAVPSYNDRYAIYLAFFSKFVTPGNHREQFQAVYNATINASLGHCQTSMSIYVPLYLQKKMAIADPDLLPASVEILGSVLGNYVLYGNRGILLGGYVGIVDFLNEQTPTRFRPVASGGIGGIITDVEVIDAVSNAASAGKPMGGFGSTTELCEYLVYMFEFGFNDTLTVV